MPEPVVLVTGANRGIGLEFARQYAARGWTVIAACRDPDRAEDLRQIAAGAGAVRVVRLDLTNGDGIDALAAELADMAIDVMVNNASFLGPFGEQNFGALNYALFDEAFATNVTGTMRLIERFVPHVAASEQKKLVVLGSAAASLTGPYKTPNQFAYRASKAALHLVTLYLQPLLAAKGIRSALLSPGLVDTAGVLDLPEGADVPEPWPAILPLVKKGVIDLIRPPESAAGMISIIDALDESAAGRFINYDGSDVPL